MHKCTRKRYKEGNLFYVLKMLIFFGKFLTSKPKFLFLMVVLVVKSIYLPFVAVCCNTLQCVCSVLQCVAVCCGVSFLSEGFCFLIVLMVESIYLSSVAVCCSVLQCVAVCCSVLQCVSMCYSVLQCFFFIRVLLLFEISRFAVNLSAICCRVAVC